jgi:hypothetical protein
LDGRWHESLVSGPIGAGCNTGHGARDLWADPHPGPELCAATCPPGECQSWCWSTTSALAARSPGGAKLIGAWCSNFGEDQIDQDAEQQHKRLLTSTYLKPGHDHCLQHQ